MNSILDMLSTPGMGMAPRQMRPYQEDVGVIPMELQDVLSRIGGINSEPDLGDPRTLSGRVQEWLGAKKPNEQGRVGEILSRRLQPQESPPDMQQEPSWEDVSQGATQTFFGGGKPVSGQDVSDERSLNLIEKMARMRGGGGNAGGATGELIERYMESTGVDFPTALQAVQTGFRQNMLMGADGSLQIIPGATDAKSALEAAETTGRKQVELQYDPLITGGEAEARNASDLQYAAPQAEQSAIGKATGEAMGGVQKKTVNAPQVLALVEQAKGILPYATGGGFAALMAQGKQYAGMSDQATQADAQLDVISAGLLNNVPRMEGPQSDADRISYEKAAGDVGNRSLPTGNRLAALQVIEGLQRKYLGASQGASGGVVNFNDLPP